MADLICDSTNCTAWIESDIHAAGPMSDHAIRILAEHCKILSVTDGERSGDKIIRVRVHLGRSSAMVQERELRGLVVGDDV